MITRLLSTIIPREHHDGFITVIYGPRRVGQMVLFNQLLLSLKPAKQLILNGDTQESRDQLSHTSEVRLTSLVADYDIVAIDEAQRIPNVGLALKIIIDKFPHKRVIVTGSSSLEPSSGIQETLTGRTITYTLFPLSTAEISPGLDSYKIPYLLPDQLLYGGYPYIQSLPTAKAKQAYLYSLTEDYLLRDLFDLSRVDSPDVVKKLATLLAFQAGSEVSLNELGQQLAVSVKTISRYLHLLEKSFVIFAIGAFSSNLRGEVARSKKYYFYDLGIRNALINQFQPLDVRTDIGALWENFLAVERLKRHHYSRTTVSTYFWRDYSDAKLDWLEKDIAGMAAFEFKWHPKKSYSTPKSFKDAYHLEAQVITRDNYLDFIIPNS